MASTSDALREKLLAFILKDKNSCWIWSKGTSGNGYGVISIGHQKTKYTHRLSYEIYKGPIPEGMLVCHTCDVPRCCNPEHLFLGTQKDNMQDCSKKGRINIPSAVGELNCKAKITEDDVRSIRIDTRTRKEIAAHYGLSQVMVSYIRSRKNWKHVT